MFSLTTHVTFRQSFVDIDMFVVGQKIEKDLDNGSCQLAIKWCADNKAKLKRLKVLNLHFDYGPCNRFERW